MHILHLLDTFMCSTQEAGMFQIAEPACQGGMQAVEYMRQRVMFNEHYEKEERMGSLRGLFVGVTTIDIHYGERSWHP